MKHIKRIFALVLVIATFVGSFAGSYYVFGKGTLTFDEMNLSIFEDDPQCYYLKKVATDIIFQVNSSDSNQLEYAVYNSSEQVVQTGAEKISNNKFNILPPKEGYLSGETYTLKMVL